MDWLDIFIDPSFNVTAVIKFNNLLHFFLIVQCPSNFPYYYNYHGAGDYCCSVKPNNWPQSRDDGCPSSALKCPSTYCTDYSGKLEYMF